MTEQIDATNTTEHMADAESTAESAKAAVRGVEETHPEYVDFAVDDFPGGLPACLEAILMVADQPQTATELARILALDRNTVEEALRALHDDYEGDESRDIRPRGFELRRTARGWQFASRAAFEPVVSSFVTDGQTARLSQAALEALAYQIRDLADAMAADAGASLGVLNVDGGASVNDFLMQFQADLLGCELRRPANLETTSLGAAYLAGLATGFWSGTDELRGLRASDDVFCRQMDEAQAEALLAGWHDAVRRTLG